MNGFILYFDYAAFLILVFLIVSVVLKRQVIGRGNKIFLSIVIVALIATILDVLASVPQFPIELLFTLNAFFFAARAGIAVTLFIYALNLGKLFHRVWNKKWLFCLMMLPYAVLLGALVANFFNKAIYDYLPGPNYVRGDFAWIAYAVSYTYVTAAIAIVFYSRRFHRKSHVFAVFSAFLLQVSASVFQFYVMNALVEMIITAVTLLTLSIYIESPENFLDYRTECATSQSFMTETGERFDLKQSFGVALLHIRNTSVLYNLYPHQKAVEFSRSFSASMREKLRKVDRTAVLYYLGESTFAAVFSDLSKEDKISEVIKLALSTPFSGGGAHFQFSATFCLVRCPEDCGSSVSLFSFSTIFFDLAMGDYLDLSEYRDEKGNVLFELDHILNRAIEEKSFSIRYQPIYSISEHRFNSAEALLRLSDPVFGTLMPLLFIPYAENSGKIAAIGKIVMEQSFAFFAKELKGKIDYLEINVSPLQLFDPSFASTAFAIAEANGLGPKDIVFEITESAATLNDPAAKANIDALVEGGYRIAIDDFGTGFSNLSRLTQLDISILKFDRSMTDLLSLDGDNEFILGLLELFKNKGMKTLFEGVEEKEIVSLLDSMGADYIQGFCFSKPLPENEFLTLLSGQKGEPKP